MNPYCQPHKRQSSSSNSSANKAANKGSYQHPSSSGARTFRGGVGGCSTRFSEERLLKRSSLFGLVSAEKKTQLGNSVLRHPGSPPGVKGEEEMFQLVPHLGLKGRPVVAKMTASGACRGQLGLLFLVLLAVILVGEASGKPYMVHSCKLAPLMPGYTLDKNECQYGSWRDQCGEYCSKGPGEVCGGKGNRYGGCGDGLICGNCDRCVGCSTHTYLCFEDDNCITY